MLERICRWYCRSFHKAITLPCNGQYECLRCLRTFPAGYR